MIAFFTPLPPVSIVLEASCPKHTKSPALSPYAFLIILWSIGRDSKKENC
jgi:hypothetical protein